MNYRPLFEDRDLRLASIDLEKDPKVIAGWTSDLTVARRLRSDEPVRPLAAHEVRKVLDEWVKEREKHDTYVFALRPRESDDLVGYYRIDSLTWVHGSASFELVIGKADDWAAYATAALELGLQFAFDELNMFRVKVRVEEFDARARSLYESANFYLEVRQRQALYEQGRYWDVLHYGMLRPEYSVYHQQMGVAA